MAQISVIIISYNTRDITDRCLACVTASSYKDYEIIVVDNASTDGSLEMVKKKYPKVKLIASKTNTGFTGGNNLAMQQAQGKYFLLLNSDAFLETDTLKNCAVYMDQHTETSVLGCKLEYADGRLQPSAGFLPNPVNTFLWVWGVDVLPAFKKFISSVHPQQPEFFAKTRQVGWVTGAFMFLRRDVFERTGGFDEKYFMYTEEVDWCHRMRALGLRIDFVADFSIVHLQAASSGLRKPYIKEMQGVIYFFKKHYPLLAPLMWLVIWGGNALRILAFTVVGNPERADIYREIIKSI